MEFLHKVEAIVILDADGNRLFTKYFPSLVVSSSSSNTKKVDESALTQPWASLEQQLSLERAIHQKARDPKRPVMSDGDILIHDGHAVLFLVEPEITYVVVGPQDENEMILNSVLFCLVEAIQGAHKSHQVDKRSLLEEYHLLLLIVDEMIDDGVLLETNPQSVLTEVLPFDVESSADGARKALNSIQKYMKQTM